MPRDYFHIIADMIKGAEGGKVKSFIDNGNGMNHPQTEKYLGICLDSKLLRPVEIGNHTRYEPTKRGRRFVKAYAFLEELTKKRD